MCCVQVTINNERCVIWHRPYFFCIFIYINQGRFSSESSFAKKWNKSNRIIGLASFARKMSLIMPMDEVVSRELNRIIPNETFLLFDCIIFIVNFRQKRKEKKGNLEFVFTASEKTLTTTRWDGKRTAKNKFVYSRVSPGRARPSVGACRFPQEDLQPAPAPHYFRFFLLYNFLNRKKNWLNSFPLWISQDWNCSREKWVQKRQQNKKNLSAVFYY